ncbi:malectin-A [Bactrocera neohumeralis]|uniref:malectin-A n=1 Tax=Bactrocera tryoni TaxID=59916 RepID=UPI001A96CD9D|nr:malectin-A [Bactrocera tryoni]XP_050320592.1 malectin-A [Bactrocera neohumeralis]
MRPNSTFITPVLSWHVCVLLTCFCPSLVLGNLKVIYAVNAGGQEHSDKHGIHYSADPLHGRIGTASDYGNHLLLIGRVPEQDEVLYRTERYHTATFGYTLPIDGDGEYALIMKFCEVYFNEPNKKVFDVVLNNKHTVVKELDIFHQVGRGTAHEEYVYFIISNDRLYYKDEQSDIRNGVVRLDFIKGHYDNPKINAFALLKGDVANIPRLPPTSDDILPIDSDMAVFNDRVSAEGGGNKEISSDKLPENQQRSRDTASSVDDDIFDEDEDNEEETWTKKRKVSGPRQPDPYSMDDSSVMLPVFIAIGAFIPLLFCLCKL